MAGELLFAGRDYPQRAPDNRPVLTPRQAADVSEVEEHDARSAGVDLMPTGNSGQPLGAMLEPAIHHTATFAVLVANHIDVLLHERARADERHVAAVDVEELRELVNTMIAQEVTESVGPAGVVLGVEVFLAVLQRSHGLQLIAHKRTTMLADSLLAKERCISVNELDETGADHDDHEDHRGE